ncbi:hypothetical protein Tco_0148915 [Tanacetum coccineum]
MHHSMCSSTSNLVFMTLVLSFWAIPLVVPLIPTFIAISLLTCPRASLVVNSIVVCRSPTVTDQMAHYVAPVAFGRTWTIMMIVAFRTQWLGPAVIFLLPVPCSVIFASILPLVRLLLVLIVLGSVIQLPLVLSLAFRKSADLFMHMFLKLHYWTLTLEHSLLSCILVVQLSLSDSTFSDGGDDEGGVAATRLRGQDHLKLSSKKWSPGLGAPPPPRPPHPSQHHHHRLSVIEDSLSKMTHPNW